MPALQVEELAKMFGYKKPSLLKNKILSSKLLDTNVCVISEGIKNGKRYNRIFVNPHVFAKSGKAPNDTLVAMFKQSQNAIMNS